MSYCIIDEIIKNWASNNNQQLLSEYKDCEVRSFEVFDEGRKFQIWIDRPTEGSVGVHVWDYKKKRKDWRALTANLYPTLDEARATIFEWNQVE
jgi:hypothetical protein